MTDSRAAVHVFVSYSHQDTRWLDRLLVHTAPVMQGYDIDVWADTRLQPGSRWQDEIRNAVERANAAVLIISADFLASDFIRTNELPPLLKAAEEEGALILPIIASPSLFLRNPDLSQFQAVNDPTLPLVSASRGEQEATFVRVAEALLDRATAASRAPSVRSSSGTDEPPMEDFLEHRTWTRLVKIGDWIFDEDKARIIGSGVGTYLLSRNEYGDAPFEIKTTLKFTNMPPAEAGKPGMNSGIIFGWKAKEGLYRYYNVLLKGSGVLVERVGFKGGREGQDYEHITDAVPLRIESDVPYRFELKATSKSITINLGGETVLSLDRPTGVSGRVGLRPWRSQMDCTEFVVSA